MAKLTIIEGIGQTLAKKFQAGGVRGTRTLLTKGGTKKGRLALSEACGLDEGRILKFVNHADLMRIKGVGGEYAELLEAAGVDSVPELARRNAANLATAMESVNATRKLVRSVPTEERISDWVGQAGKLGRAVSH